MSTAQRSLPTWIAFLLLVCTAGDVSAREDDDPAATILGLDGQFWTAYNACDIDAQRRFFADDIEFYHDKGGATFGVAPLMDTIRKNLCSGSTRVRREAVEGTVHVFPMRRDGVLYGAIVSGDHRFYVREEDRPEALTGIAKFANLWLLNGGAWKMARVLSYDHAPASHVTTRKPTAIPAAVLDSYAGRYRTRQGVGTIRRENGTLILSFDNGSFTLHPESEAVFFTKERDLTFEFARRADGVRIVRVRENGAVVDEGVAEE